MTKTYELPNEKMIMADVDEKHHMATVSVYALNDLVKEVNKYGHWEWLTEDKYRCSNCNSETRVDECMNEPMYEFCPFCGAKMKSEGEE